MKLFGAFLTLQALATASAFTASPLKSTGKTQLFSTAGPGTTSPGYTSKTGDWNIREVGPNVKIQGQTRHTWNFGDYSREIVQVALKTEGRPMTSDIELWVGPDWTPLQISAYTENGKERPIQTLIGTRNKAANVEIRNTGASEFPLTAACSYAVPPLADARDVLAEEGEGRYVEGGAIYSQAFPSDVGQVALLLKTDGKQLNAKVELLNGPNNVKQGFEIFTNNGELNALYVVFETPGAANTVRIRNIAPLEFPCYAYFQTVAGMPETETSGSLMWN